MLVTYCLHQTGRRLVVNTSRSTLSALYSSKSSETKTDVNSNNYPGFYNTANAGRVELNDLRKTLTKPSNIESTVVIPPNDLLEAKRLEEQRKNDKTTPSTPVATSSEKFSSGILPISPTSSITPSGENLFHEVKISTTPLSPGIPVTGTKPLTVNRSSTTADEYPKKVDQIPSSRFSAFLRGISSGLPFFPSSKTKSIPVDIATTREYFIPVGF